MTVLFLLEGRAPMIGHPRRTTTSPLASGIRRSLSYGAAHRTDYGEVRETSLSALENTLAAVVVHANQTGVCQYFPVGKPANENEKTMTKNCEQTLTPNERAARSDADIDYNNIPELDEEFQKDARVTPPRAMPNVRRRDGAST
jgi:hypothetical protein